MSRWQDSNLRPPAPKAGALASCATPRGYTPPIGWVGLAERVGFEPTVPLRARFLSKEVLSTTQPSLRDTPQVVFFLRPAKLRCSRVRCKMRA